MAASRQPARLNLLLNGADMSAHRSQDKQDYALSFSIGYGKYPQEHILGIVPAVRKRLYLLKEFAKIPADGFEYSGPYRQSPAFYEMTF